MSEELQKCPFCGQKADVYNYGGQTDYVECASEDCPMHEQDGVMIEAWNDRPLERAAYLRGLQRAVEVAKDKHASGIHGSHEVSLQIIAALEAEIAKGGHDAG